MDSITSFPDAHTAPQSAQTVFYMNAHGRIVAEDHEGDKLRIAGTRQKDGAWSVDSLTGDATKTLAVNLSTIQVIDLAASHVTANAKIATVFPSTVRMQFRGAVIETLKMGLNDIPLFGRPKGAPVPAFMG